MIGKVDFDKDLNIHIPLQSTTQVSYDYRRNDYKELDTWGQTLALDPPFTLNSTQSQHVSVDYVEPL